MSDIKLKEFDIKSIKFSLGLSPNIVIIGRRSTGKTFLTGEILKNFKDITRGTIIAGLKDEHEFYSNLIPTATIHDAYSSTIIKNVIKQQNLIYKQVKNGVLDLDVEMQKTFVVMDNCFYDASVWRDKLIRLLYMNGSVYKIMSILTMSCAHGIPPAIRSQFDYIFIFKEKDPGCIRRTWELCCQDYIKYIKYDDFCFIMRNMSDYDALVIYNSYSDNDVIYYYKGKTA